MAGAAAPVMQMSIAPFEAQKRAKNLGIAESAAVTYVATNEWTTSLDTTPSGCANPVKLASGAYSITCSEGEGTQYVQSVTRSFRLDDSCDATTATMATAIAVAMTAPTLETEAMQTMFASSTFPPLQNSQATNARPMTPGE